ncbi:MAG TPA: ATP-binding cassette domain-containing protein, partial [Burkholderiaceae bacterium]
MSAVPITGPSANAVLSVQGLKAYYETRHFGVEREVRAVDGIDFEVRRNEIYGLAGESSSGKTTLIKTIAAAWKPPLRIVAGAVSFTFAPDILRMSADDLARVRWKHLAYIVQGSMSVLNPVRRIRESFVDFAFRHLGVQRAEFDN